VRNRKLGAGLIALALGLLAGCAMENPFIASSSPSDKPLVWDCSMIQMASPPRYACSDDKVYTAFQLADVRQGVAPAPSKPAFGVIHGPQ